MAAFSSFCLRHPPISTKIENFAKTSKIQQNVRNSRGFAFSFRNQKTDLFRQTVSGLGIDSCRSWSFIGGSKFIVKPKLPKHVLPQKGGGVYASWLANSQIASSAFTLGTVAVLPFYSLMVLAPKAVLTRRSMQSNVPYVVLGFLYAYLLYLSWTPETVRQIFASKYLLPELPGILKMFSSEMTLASAWIHLLVVDLFAARQVYYDGLENQIETRHSISLCLFFCPVGILIHVITKAVARTASTSNHGM